MRSFPTPFSQSRAWFALLAVALAIGPVVLTARPAHAATTFVVTTAGDNPDADLADDRCDTAPGPGAPCSLRAAIQEANATPGPDTIKFNIPGGGLKTIQPASQLPTIVTKMTIDGYTQPGSSPNTTATGTNAVLTIELDGSNAGQGADGLGIEGANVFVRGLVINRFANAIRISGEAIGTRVQGCFLGTDAAGTAARGNARGLSISAGGTVVGGSGPAARNLIAGNTSEGIDIFTEFAGTRILGNLIGTDRSGAGDLGNGGGNGTAGVFVRAPAAIIGGATVAEANVIAFNGDDSTGNGDGVEVSDSGAGIRILRNSIFANVDLGIDLGDDGVTANDPQDTDDGANTLQNFPVITTATSTSVTGTLNSTPDQDFVLRLFSNPGQSRQGRFSAAGPLVVTTDANGDASFTFTPDPPLPAGRWVTATATNQGGSTSEFSAAKQVTAS